MIDRPYEIDRLIAEHKPGHAMPRGFYTSQAIYDYDIAQVWNRNWLWAGHESQIPNPGDYFLFDYAHESIIVVRDRDGEVRAHLNVCRHRGSRVCTEAREVRGFLFAPTMPGRLSCQANCGPGNTWVLTLTHRSMGYFRFVSRFSKG